MRAALIAELGSPPRPAELPDVPGVEVEAVALNPLDIAVGNGRFYGGHPPLPYPPGCEAAGRAEDGTLVYLFGEGRGVVQPGFLAERVSVPDELPVRPPDGVDPALAAGADPLDFRIEHALDRVEVACNKRAIPAQEEVDPGLAHARSGTGKAGTSAPFPLRRRPSRRLRSCPAPSSLRRV